MTPARHVLSPRWLVVLRGWVARFSPLLALAGAAIVVVTLSSGASTRKAQDETGVALAQRDATADQALAGARPIVELCRGDDMVGQALRAAPDNPCERAERIVAQPVAGPRGHTGATGATGPGAPDAQVAAQVADYLRRNPPPPGRAPTTQEIADAAAAYLRDNPPQPGRPPSPEETAAAVRAYLAANPPAAGKDGAAGRPPTPEEIRTAVDAALAEHPPPAGPQGVSVTAVAAENRDGQCVLVFTLTDPADGMSREQAVGVGDAVCGDPGILGGP